MDTLISPGVTGGYAIAKFWSFRDKRMSTFKSLEAHRKGNTAWWKHESKKELRTHYRGEMLMVGLVSI